MTLEERATKASCEAGFRALGHKDKCHYPECACIGASAEACAVLKLVREEQMKADPQAFAHFHMWWSSQAAQVRSDE